LEVRPEEVCPAEVSLPKAHSAEGGRVELSTLEVCSAEVRPEDVGRLERRPGIRERIEYLSHEEEELIPEKRRRIEEALWMMHDADIGDCFETYEVAKVGRDGKLVDQV
jgi:hypothetical protein